MPSRQVIQPTQQSQVATKREQQQFRWQSTSFLVIDDQQVGPSRLTYIHIDPMKHFNPPTIASATGEESQHKLLGLSLLLTCQQQPPLHPPPPPPPHS